MDLVSCRPFVVWLPDAAADALKPCSPSEIHHMRVRGKAVSAATATNWMFKCVSRSFVLLPFADACESQLRPRLVNSSGFPQHPVRLSR